ncbi:F-box/FBD/LRR-repeat protein At1g78750 [Arachis duranensis]|uniref:F-box/FBD/LRR-repeat protein At1g78750 n=3 Tax=Arachis TaxID=3817 RepID=A0A6P4B9I8_ARADU|nr:F-box/FBD/LRR-repeat protein At1g78750 [Arachis duranensis]XP_052109684.1 F-box/FBD/LRR-repeat protein At1g78750 [Arachis duranensis]
MDRLSGLPKTILHDILARLSDKDAAKTIALSKAWRDTWYSFPNLSVCSGDFFTIHDIVPGSSHRFSKMHILFDYVTKRLLRLRDQGLAIKELKLSLTNLLNPTRGSHHVDQWIQMASENGVKVLELHLTGGCIGRDYSQDNWYDLPLCVIEAKSLAKLELAGGIRIDQEFLNHSMKFSSVKSLFLSQVLFTHERIIEHLISHCTLIEHLTMNYCSVYNHLSTEDPLVQRSHRVKSLFLNGLQKLKDVDVQGIQEVQIDSPNLQNLRYRPLDFDAPFKLNFDSCTNLRCLCLLYLQSTAIADKWFLELFSKYPFLESLKLGHCSMSERINILSAQLKVFKLSHCSNLKEINVDAPNLLSFDYVDDNKPVISFLRGSNKLEVSVCTLVDLRDFYSLRKFIRNIPQNILASLSLFIYEQFHDYTYLHEFQVSSTPPSIKHLEFKVYSFPKSESPYGHLMHCLLSSCFPKTISFRYSRRYTFIEFFYEMLMGSKKGECHCSSGDRKCWWHALKIVNISCSFMTDENTNFKAMLDASPKSSDWNTITFSLEL